MSPDPRESGTESASSPLADRYLEMVCGQSVSWTAQYRLLRQLGRGGQGVVCLAERLAAHNIAVPVALKFFSPASYSMNEIYRSDMQRIARLTGILALVQDHHLLNVQNFVDCDGIHVMVTEYVDGFDLSQLVHPAIAAQSRRGCSQEDYDRFKQIVFEESVQLSLKPGVAVAILRNCLAAVGAMHRVGMIHGDLKPSNIMLKRSGTAKVVDFGSATELGEVAPYRKWTPLYAAVEVMLGGECTPRSDLCSLGYVLVELLAGRPPFPKADSYTELIELKRNLPQRLGELLPAEVLGNKLLMQFIMGLIAPDPAHRFASAEAADLSETGAAAFHRQLVHGNLSCEYQNDLRLWVQSLGEVPPFDGAVSLTHATSAIVGSSSPSQ